MKTRTTGYLLKTCSFLLVYFFARLHNLLAMPFFVDETQYVDPIQNFWKGQVLTAASEGRLLRIWYNAFLAPYPPGAGWAWRAGTILVCMVAVAAFYRLIRSFVSHRAGLIGIVLLTITPYFIFFERLALADTLLGACTVLAVFFAWRLVKTADGKIAVLLGGAISVVLLAKVSGIVWLPLPIVAVLVMQDVPWKKRFQLGLIAYLVLACLWGPFLVVLKIKGYNYLGLAPNAVGDVNQSLTNRTWDNIQIIWQVDRDYLGLPVVLLAILGGVYWLRLRPRSALFALLVLGMGASGCALFSAHVNSRYVLNQAIWVLLPLVVGAGLAMEGRQCVQGLVYGALTVWAVAFCLPFQLTAWNHARDLSLTRNDRLAYITGEASGFGIREAGEKLKVMNEPLPVIGLVSNCQTLRLIAHPVNVTCPTIRWDGTSQQELMAWTQQQAANGPIIVVGENLSYMDLSHLPQPNTVLETFKRPEGRLVFVYRVEQGAVVYKAVGDIGSDSLNNFR